MLLHDKLNMINNGLGRRDLVPAWSMSRTFFSSTHIYGNVTELAVTVGQSAVSQSDPWHIQEVIIPSHYSW